MDSSNCTFMELKYKQKTTYRTTHRSSNCTFMELKSPWGEGARA